FKHRSEQTVHRLGRSLSCGSIVPHVRVPFDARVLVSEWLLRRRIDQLSHCLLTDRAAANRLGALGYGWRGGSQRIIKSVRCIRVLGELDVVPGAAKALHVGLAGCDG